MLILTQLRGIFHTVRASEWWQFKLAPMCGVIFASAFLIGVPILSLWRVILLALIGLASCATYVSLINDLTDREDDQASGKPNRLVGKSRTFIAGLLAFSLLVGSAVAIYWRRDTLLMSLYVAPWITFALYSLPPLRLKVRGVFGVLADASGAHFFPSLFAVALVCRSVAAPIDLVWFSSVGVWSLSFGIRGILGHQISDLENDDKIGLPTFARRHKLATVNRMANFVILPTEVGALAIMLWHAGNHLAIAFLGIYAVLEWLKRRLLGMRLDVTAWGGETHRIVMHEYYELMFPLAFAVASAMRYPLDFLLVPIQLLLFPKRSRATLFDLAILARAAWRKSLRLRRGDAH